MISIIMPAYNEAANILGTISETVSALSSLLGEGRDFEIIVVDDHSSDRTYDLVAGLQDPRVKCLYLNRRLGSHIALRAGMHHARGDAVCVLAADGQDDPQALPGMIAKWRGGADIVFALRKDRDNEALVNRVLAKSFYALLNRLTPREGRDIDISRVDFYLLDRKVLDAVNACPERSTSLFGLIMWLGFERDFIVYDRRPRNQGRSAWTTRSRLKLAVDWVIAFSGLPLRVISLCGLVFSAGGLLLAAIIVVRALLFNITVPGWASIMVAVLIMGGIQLLMMGIFGEYLWRNLDESRSRPLYWIEKSTLAEKD